MRLLSALLLASWLSLSTPAHAGFCDLYLSLLADPIDARAAYAAIADHTAPNRILTRRGARLFLLEQEAIGLLERPLVVPECDQEQRFSFLEPLTTRERVGRAGLVALGIIMGLGSGAAALLMNDLPLGLRAMFLCPTAACGVYSGILLAQCSRAPTQRDGPRAIDQLEPVAQSMTEAVADHACPGYLVWGAVVIERRFMEALREQLLDHGWHGWRQG